MKSAKASIASRYAVVSGGFEELQKLQDALGVEILDAQLLDIAAGVTRDEPQHQHDGVTITAYRVHTHAPLFRKILLEEPRDADAQIGRTGALHDSPPATM